jgi:hypothetical protein
LLDGIESMNLAVNNFVVMVVDTFQIDLSHVFIILGDSKVNAMLQFMMTLFHDMQMILKPPTFATQPDARTISACSNTVVMGSIPT